MTIYNAVPTLSLMPLRNCKFEVLRDLTIEIPRRGDYHKLAPGIFSEDDGAFDILDDNILYLPAITKALLAVNKYPELKSNQVFTPYAFEFEGESMFIFGKVLEIISVEE